MQGTVRRDAGRRRARAIDRAVAAAGPGRGALCLAEVLEARRLLAGVFAVSDANLESDDPDDQISEAIPTGNGTVAGQLAAGDDVDLYSVAGSAGDGVSFRVVATREEPVLLTQLRLFDAAGAELASHGSSFDYFLPAAGTYYVGVSEAGNAYDPVTGDDPDPTAAGGGYSLTIRGATVSQPPFGPAGGEFRANSHLPDRQHFPATAMDTDGDFVVAWASKSQDETPGSTYGVYAQRYSAAGVARGGEFLVNTTVTENQFEPQVAMDAAGNFVVVWRGNDDFDAGIFARRYNAAGVAQGVEFPVNTHKTNFQTSPTVAMDADGDFVVAWQSLNQVAGSSANDIYAQRYTKTGATAGDEFPVNTEFTATQQRFPTAAMDAGGNFVIAWESTNHDPGNPTGTSTGVYAQQYNAAGMPRGNEFRVHAYFLGDQNLPSAAMDADGDFVVTWHGYDPRDGNGVYARAFNPAGVAPGGDIQVNTFETSFQRHTAIAMDADGDFVISWQNEFVDANDGGTSIDAQRFAAGGARVGTEFRVNSTTLGNHTHPAAAMDADGDFVLAWASYGQDPGDGANNSGIYAQRYAADRPAVTADEFLHQSSPHRLRITFSQNVSATLSAADLSVVMLGAGGGTVTFLAPVYDAATNTATFAFGGSGVLPNGNYRATLRAAGVTNAAGTVVAADHVLDFFVLAGDVNRDRAVNGTDFAILAGNFGRTGRTYGQGDLNGDGNVNGTDFALLAGNFGKSVPAPAAAVTAPTVPATLAATTVAPTTKRAAATPRKVPPARLRAAAKSPRPSRSSPFA